jgi:Raf kinase inhibitor-like YbhB/YbcL family protein
MKKAILLSLLMTSAALPVWAQNSATPGFTITVGGIVSGQPIADKFTYCKPDGNGATTNSANINPAISWSNQPIGTQSYALAVIDPDVPVNFGPANKPDQVIPADAPRNDFYHWVLVNIPLSVNSIPEGVNSHGVDAGGKVAASTPYGLNGVNSFSPSNGGYDGPCPPWNDLRLHHYHFIVYALNVPTISLYGGLTGKLMETGMAGHILATAEIVGTYTTNPALATSR